MSDGVKIEVRGFYKKPFPEQKAGEHLWVVLSMFRVTPAYNARCDLDRENLITVDGPGCFWCEEAWSVELQTRPCRGKGRES